MQFVGDYLRSMINYFGYSELPKSNNSLGIYGLEKVTDEDYKLYRYFERHNKNIMKEVSLKIEKK